MSPSVQLMLYMPGFIGVAMFHCEEWMFNAYNASLCNVVGPQLGRADDVCVWTILETAETAVLQDIAARCAPVLGLDKKRSSLEAFCHDKNFLLKVGLASGSVHSAPPVVSECKDEC